MAAARSSMMRTRRRGKAPAAPAKVSAAAGRGAGNQHARRNGSRTRGTMSEELVYKSASELAAMVRTKRVSSRERLDAFTAQIARRNPAVNAVVQLDLDRARALASAADEQTARGTIGLGALHGVPMTVKDSFMTEGVTTTSGAPELADFVPDVDAVPVGRLKSAGAIVF